MKRVMGILTVSLLLSASVYGQTEEMKKEAEKMVEPKEAIIQKAEESAAVEVAEYVNQERQFLIRANVFGFALLGSYLVDAEYKIEEKITVGVNAGFFGPSVFGWGVGKLIEAEIGDAGDVDVDFQTTGYNVGVLGSYNATGNALEDGLNFNPFLNYGKFGFEFSASGNDNPLDDGSIEVSRTGLSLGSRVVYQTVSDSGLTMQFGGMIGYQLTGEYEFGGSKWNAVSEAVDFSDPELARKLQDAVEEQSSNRFSWGLEFALGYVF